MLQIYFGQNWWTPNSRQNIGKEIYNQCDQIWRNFPTLALSKMSLAILLGYI